MVADGMAPLLLCSSCKARRRRRPQQGQQYNTTHVQIGHVLGGAFNGRIARAFRSVWGACEALPMNRQVGRTRSWVYGLPVGFWRVGMC